MNGVMSAGEWCEPEVLCLTLLSKNAHWDPSSYEPCGNGKVGITVFCPRAAFGSGRTYAVKQGIAGRGNVGSVVRAARPLATKSAISACFGHLGVVTRHLLSRTSPPTHLFSLVSISPRIYAFFILPSISQFVIPCLVVFLFLPPSSDAPRCYVPEPFY